MEFSKFKQALQKNFKEMSKDATHLFEVDVDKDEMWNLYLDSFPAERNKIYRERREHDCSCCRHFIKTIGNAVTIKDNVIHSIWDIQVDDDAYQIVADTLAAYIKSHPVKDVWTSYDKKIGTDVNHENDKETGEIVTWEHFYLELPDKFIFNRNRSFGDIKGGFRDTKNVFKRSLDEITVDSVMTVLELIQQNSLYKGEEWKTALAGFLKYKKEYDKLKSETEKELYAWEKSILAGVVIGKIRNHSIGTLLVNISEDMDLDTAVRKYEQIVAPANYKRPKAIYTKKMLEDAKKKIEDLGYMNSLGRRFATLDDITINNILFSNKDAQKRMNGEDIFAEMESEIAVNPKKFSRVEEVSAEDFVKNVLPTAKEVEVLLENRHASNMVSLIAPKNADSPTMFKWSNSFGWAYSGNITDSDIRENVKSAGGAVDGVLRFSIQWNDIGEWDKNDLDAHCKEPSGREIFFGNMRSEKTKGLLDVDITHPKNGVPAVENIAWKTKNTMEKGKYTFYVHQYSNRGGKSGFRAEIEFNGTIYSFDYQKELRQKEKVPVAEVTFDGENFSIKELLPSSMSVREVWGLKTNQFVPVSVICYSPNYWDEQNGIGHRHYFFMLKDCVNDEMPNGFYNEFLKNELTEHKRVFEALGSKMHVEDVDDQLSGVGFSATKRNDVIVKVKGASERVIKVKF